MPSGFGFWPLSASSLRRRTDVMKTLSGSGVPPGPGTDAIGDPSGVSTQPRRRPVLFASTGGMVLAVGFPSGSTPDAVAVPGLKNDDALTAYGPGNRLSNRNPASGSLVVV